LRHLGVGPGEKGEIDLVPNGRVVVRTKPRGLTEDFIGCAHRPGTTLLTIEEINEIIADGWAGIR
jgi:antitoxin PrlF